MTIIRQDETAITVKVDNRLYRRLNSGKWESKVSYGWERSTIQKSEFLESQFQQLSQN